MKRAVLIVDDEEAVRESLADFFRDRLDFDVLEANDGAPALEHLERSRFDLVVTDLLMPEVDGVRVIEAARHWQPDCPVIVVSGTGAFQDVIDAMRAGAYDFIRKPIADFEELRSKVDRALERSALVRENRTLREAVRERFDFANLIGSSPAMTRVLELAAKIAHTQSTALLLGESGTGKELLARAIHGNGPRRHRPFVALNCAALPEGLLESELFGHERGAFTGAERTQKGRIERAHEGTLFLDEIGEMSAPLQAKLLRVLQEREFERVGGSTTIRVDVRVLAATHRDLEAMVATGSFRQDLYYRLNVFPITLPPLRERVEDVEELAQHFLARFAETMGRTTRTLTREALDALRSHPWPGNVRELQNLLERAVLLADGGPIRPEHLDLRTPATRPAGTASVSVAPGTAGELAITLPPGGVALDALERAAIRATLEQVDHNVTEAARRLGMDRGRLRYRLRKYGLGR